MWDRGPAQHHNYVCVEHQLIGNSILSAGEYPLCNYNITIAGPVLPLPCGSATGVSTYTYFVSDLCSTGLSPDPYSGQAAAVMQGSGIAATILSNLNGVLPVYTATSATQQTFFYGNGSSCGAPGARKTTVVVTLNSSLTSRRVISITENPTCNYLIQVQDPFLPGPCVKYGTFTNGGITYNYTFDDLCSSGNNSDPNGPSPAAIIQVGPGGNAILSNIDGSQPIYTQVSATQVNLTYAVGSMCGALGHRLTHVIFTLVSGTQGYSLTNVVEAPLCTYEIDVNVGQLPVPCEVPFTATMITPTVTLPSSATSTTTQSVTSTSTTTQNVTATPGAASTPSAAPVLSSAQPTPPPPPPSSTPPRSSLAPTPQATPTIPSATPPSPSNSGTTTLAPTMAILHVIVALL